MAVIVPAILEADHDRFLSKVDQICKIPDLRRIQIDICDGKFAPHKTIGLNEIEVLNPVFEWEAHLMVEKPEDYFFDLKLLGFSCAIIHYEAVSDKTQLAKLADQIHQLKMTAGLAINEKTPVEDALPFADMFDQILLLEVDPGAQGQVEAPDTPQRLQKLKNSSKNLIIEVDGGVNLGNARELGQAGANFLVVGSALYAENASPAENFEKLTLNL